MKFDSTTAWVEWSGGIGLLAGIWIRNQQKEPRSTADDVRRELTGLRSQQDQLLNLRLLGEIEPNTFARKNVELRDRIAALTLQLESSHRRRDERADMVQQVLEISQSLTERWLTADYSIRRQILEMICLNFTLDGATLVPKMNKPFDMLVEGLFVSSSQGDRI